MRQLVESLRRLYIGNKILEHKVMELYSNGVITEIEKNYILKG